ncbi:MAG: ComF family protein [Halieaceae bacterium]|nr:ComF family protein [Halieaceae bacterium]
MSRFLSALVNSLVPSRCSLCSGATGREIALCLACEGELPWLVHCCRQCALPLPPGGTYCGQCLQTPPPLDRTVAACAYMPPISGWVQAGKDKGDMASLMLLAALLSRAVAATIDEPQLLVPVPLHWRRQWRRGFNQAAVLARHLHKHPRLAALGLARPVPLARRILATPPQRGLDAAARRRNLKQVFAVDANVGGKHVVLVDDVMTTGATLNALAAALKAAGAHRVSAWCCARTLPPSQR